MSCAITWSHWRVTQASSIRMRSTPAASPGAQASDSGGAGRCPAVGVRLDAQDDGDQREGRKRKERNRDEPGPVYVLGGAGDAATAYAQREQFREFLAGVVPG